MKINVAYYIPGQGISFELIAENAEEKEDLAKVKTIENINIRVQFTVENGPGVNLMSCIGTKGQ